MGIGFLLQSNNQAPAYLYNRYLDFYAQADKRLKSLKEADFNQYKLALVNQLRQRPQTLDEEADASPMILIVATLSSIRAKS